MSNIHALSAISQYGKVIKATPIESTELKGLSLLSVYASLFIAARGKAMKALAQPTLVWGWVTWVIYNPTLKRGQLAAPFDPLALETGLI